MAGSAKIDALGQFHLMPGMGAMGHMTGFANSNQMMVVAVLLILFTFAMALRQAAVVPVPGLLIAVLWRGRSAPSSA